MPPPPDKSYYRKGSQGQCREYYTQPPAPAELAATLAAIRQAELARLAAQPVPSKTARAKAEAQRARQQRRAQLHPMILEAVMAATGGGAESWVEED